MRDIKELNSIDGLEYLASVPDGEIIKHMASNNGEIFIATDKHIYMLENGKWLKEIN